MNSNLKERNIIFKSWSKVDEITLIKEVATKGEHIDLCLEYISIKKNITPIESNKFFHKIIDKYVYRLLNDKLVYKAEHILENVSRNFKAIFYQFYFECKDTVLRPIILDYLQKKVNGNENFQLEYENYKFHWNTLKLIENERIKMKFECDFKDLESLIKLSELEFNNLLLKLYFMTYSADIVKKLSVNLIWNHLIKELRYDELVTWLQFNSESRSESTHYSSVSHDCRNAIHDSDNISHDSANVLNNNEPVLSNESDQSNIKIMKYINFEISDEMIEYGCENIENPPELIRDYFIYRGYVFKDEEVNLAKMLNRILRTQTFHKNEGLIKRLPEYLCEMKLYQLLLEQFLNEPIFEKVICNKENENEKNILNFIQSVQSIDIVDNESYLKLSKISSIFLEKYKGFQLNPVVHLAELFADEKAYWSIGDIKNSFNCTSISFYQKRHQLPAFDEIKTISEKNIFVKYVNIDLEEIFKNQFLNGLPTFSNYNVSGKYGKLNKPNYLHYLNQQRSGFALYNFLLEQLKNYPQITKSQLIGAVEICTESALNLCQNGDNFIHYTSFIEMIDFDSQALRSFAWLIKSNNLQNLKTINIKNMIEIAETNLLENFDSEIKEFPLNEYSNLMRISQSYCQSKTLPQIYLKYLAQRNNWWKLLLLAQYFEIPIKELLTISHHFQYNIMGEHFLRPLSTTDNKFKRKGSISRSNKTDSSSAINSGCDTMTSSVSSNYTSDLHNLAMSSNEDIKFINNISNNNKDLFSLIILSWNYIPTKRIESYSKYLEIIQDKLHYPLSINLMKNSLKYKRSILAVLATLVDCDDVNIDWNWVTWLSTRIENFKLIEICKNFKNFSMKIIEHCVRKGHTKTLHQSFEIFFKKSKFLNLTQFLCDTADLKFTDDSITALRLYYVAWSNDEIHLPFSFEEITKDQIMHFTVKLFILHLKYNFSSNSNQHKFLNLISSSGISDITPLVDFNLLKTAYKIISTTLISFDFEQLLNVNATENLYQTVIENLIRNNEYDRAIDLSILLNLPITDYVYQKWIEIFDQNEFNFKFYETEVEKYVLSPDFLVNFYLHVAKESQCYLKYILMKKSLDIIKHNHLFPNETFNRDQIEYDMILCYLECDDLIDSEIYHSEYYEEILIKENLVLYKSFVQLKELAGIEDLTTNMKFKLTGQMEIKFCDLIDKLLDAGDIIEALRLQAMFECPTIDLRYLAFCMALAEGLTSIYNLSDEERSIFMTMEKSAKLKFDKRILETASATTKQYTIENNSFLEFEEIPSKEKQEILNVIQGFASSLKHGVIFGQRIVMVYRAAMYLDKDYVDVLRTKDSSILLKSAAKEECLKKLLVVNDIFTSTQMSPTDIADYLAYEITKAIIRPVFYILTADQSSSVIKNSKVWDYDINREFHLFLELCPNTTILGKTLLEYGDMLKVYRKCQDNQVYEHSNTFEKLRQIIEKYGLPRECLDETRNMTISAKPMQVLSHKKQNTIYVELLIKAHECFTHECSMEGLGDILNRAKTLNTILANAKSWKLIVRCLTGIGRYREMFYCFETLLKNDQFEFLLGQFDEEKIKGFKHAILSYIHDHCPQNQKLFEIVALHFLMYSDLAEMWEKDANLLISTLNTIEHSSVKNVKRTILKCTPDTINKLNKVLESLVLATENYLLDNKLSLASKCANQAELVAMQIDFATKGLHTNEDCHYFLKIQSRDEFKEYLNFELSVPQAAILKNSYPEYDVNWSEVLLWQYVLSEKAEYFTEFCTYMELTDSIIENVIKGFQMQFTLVQLTAKMESHLSNLIDLIQSVSLKYKLSSLLGLKKILQKIINSDNNYCLKDTNYGRNQF